MVLAISNNALGEPMRPLKNTPFCPISVSGSNYNPRNTTCIPAVIIFAFLEFEQISGDFEVEHFSKVSQ